MQDLEDALEYITAALPIDVQVHDVVLPEMNPEGSYPECEGANLDTILDTNVTMNVK